MKKMKTILFTILVLALIGGGYTLYNYYYQSQNFFTTENAQVTANLVTITPEVTGKLTSWDVKEGDMVKEGQILGHQDINMMISSSQMNSQALTSSANSSISKADIKSPIDGKVIQSTIIPGQILAPGMEAAIIADVSNIYIKTNIEETEIFKIAPGQKVDITIDAYKNKQFTGYVTQIGQATQSTFSAFPSLNTSGTYSKVVQLIPVKVGIVNEENLSLMPGMNATVKIHIK